MKNVPLKEVMVSPVVTVHRKDPFSAVEEKFRRKGIRHLPVIDDDGVLVGLVTQRDLYRTISPHVTDEGPYYDPEILNHFVLRHVMTKDPVTLAPEDPMSKAIEIMTRRKFSCIPVVDRNKKVVGIVTEIDVLRFVGQHLF